MRKVLAGFPGVNFALKPFLTERVEESLSGYTASVIVNIYGNDLNELDATAKEVAQELERYRRRRAKCSYSRRPACRNSPSARARRDLERWGLDTVEVLNVLRTAYQGDIVGQTYEGSRVFNVMAILDKESRENVANVANLPLRTRAGNFVLLKQIADVVPDGRALSGRPSRRARLQAVTANVIGRDVSSFVAEAEETLNKKCSCPAGVHVEFAGSAQAQAQAQRDLIMNSLVAGLGILILLHRRHRKPAQRSARARQHAVRDGRRRARRVRHRRRADARLDGRLRHAVRHHAAQLDHDDLALRAHGRRRRRAVGTARRPSPAPATVWRRSS